MPKGRKSQFSGGKNSGSRSPSQESRKGQIPKKIASKLKKLELNCTNLMLKSKKNAKIAAKSLIQALALDYKSKIRQLRSYLTLDQVVISFS